MPEFNTWFPSSSYGSDVVNVKGFGAIGDGLLNTMTDLGYANLAAAQVDYPKATNMADSADWCGIQAAVDYAIQNGIICVRIPNGVYLTTDTIHLGYGMEGGTAALCCVQLEGAGWASLSGLPTGATIIAQFVDRPGINLQGGRQSGVRRLRVQGPIEIIDPSGQGPNYKADRANYIPTGAATSDKAPFCGICIDGYFPGSGLPLTEADNHVPTGPYPTPRFPAWVQSGTNAYNKAQSSMTFVEDCQVYSTMVGVMLQPCGDGNGDFLKCTRTSVIQQMIGFAWGNSQARNMDFSNCTVDGCHTAFDNCSYGNHIGNCQGTYDNISTQGCYQIFNCDFQTGAPAAVTGLYGESNCRLGKFVGIIQLDGCHLSCHDATIEWPSTGINSITWSGGIATVTTSTSLASAKWTYGTTGITITANPAGYNVSNGVGTRTGASTFTYEVAVNPGAFVSGTVAIPQVTEWLQEPFFEGALAQFRNCMFFDHALYHFVGRIEFTNVSFQGHQGYGDNTSGGILTEGHRKAVAALGRVIVSQSMPDAMPSRPFAGHQYTSFGRNYDFPEGSMNWDGLNGNTGWNLWGHGQKDNSYALEYDTFSLSRMYQMGDLGAISAMPTGITRVFTATDTAAFAEPGDLLWPVDQAWYAVESIVGSDITAKQITNFKMVGGVYTSLNSVTDTTHYLPIGVLDLKPANMFYAAANGLFMKTTAGSPTISFVDGADVAVNRPSEIGLKSKPLWYGQNAVGLANSLPFPRGTTISVLAPTATTLTMSANALTTGTWAYGPGIKRLK